MKNGIDKIFPHRKDFSLLHTFLHPDEIKGTRPIFGDTGGLPDNFSIYDGRPIPNQNQLDTRFIPAVRPLPYGCVGETGTFDAGLQDGAAYPPDDFYFAIPPGTDGVGRDIRTGLQTAINRGFKLPDGTIGAKRTAYFNCYGSGAIDDFDAARIAVWINQTEKRGVWIGSWWYPEFESPDANGSLPVPSFNMSLATLHCHLAVGWRTLNGVEELQDLSWQGMNYAQAGVDWISRADYNALMAQPYTGAFTQTKLQGQTPVPIGMIAVIDHLVYFIKSLFNV